MKRPAAAAEVAKKRPAAEVEAAVTAATAVTAALVMPGFGDGVADDSAVEAEAQEEQAKSEILNM